MKAIVYTKYGTPEVLRLAEIEKPVPKANEVLVRNYATTATLFDCWMRSSTSPPGFGIMMRMANGIRGPKRPILGTDLAGEIEAIGKDVKLYKTGDQVYGFTGLNLGAYAEYICLPEEGMLAKKPVNMTFPEAAAVPQGALTALYYLRKGQIQIGNRVLIFGASGGVGSYAVQIAKHLGAEVTGVCSPRKRTFIQSLGAETVIDYTQKDFDKNFETYDIIFDTIGMSPFTSCIRALKKDGFYLLNNEIKQYARFSQVNLFDTAAMRKIVQCDVVFCANVLIYFDVKAKQKVVSHLYNSLNRGGYLFIGYSESLHGVSKAFKLIHLSKAMAYFKE